ncbi:MAG TPA: hypothetical protein VFE03_01730 [Caulobacteraceae bacterium]|nr:hypothetical protein [Caulobacteraceae bacterium]
MRLQLVLAATAVVLVAGPAAAQGYGTFAPGQSPPPGSYKPPSLSSVYAKSQAPSSSQRNAGTATGASGFKPYEPYRPSSVYAQPRPAARGAKPCETSVYVNACGSR